MFSSPAAANAEVLEVAALPRPKDVRPVEAFNPVDPPSHLLRSVYAVFQLEAEAILASAKVPDVILEAARLGIRAVANVPEVMSDAAWE